MAMIDTPMGWANGIGIYELIEKVSKFPPSVVIHDPQWGHPGTALQVFKNFYPQVQMVRMTNKIFANLVHIKSLEQLKNKDLYFIFDSWWARSRPWVASILNDEEICGTKEVIEKKYKEEVSSRTSIIICSPNR
jgi:hypothetical protein